MEINPNDIIQPQGNVEKIASLFQKGGVTKDLVERLSDLDTIITFPDGTKKEITMKDVDIYIERELDFINKHYPPDARYSPSIEKKRQRAFKMKEMQENKNYKALIRPMLDLAVKKWKIADKMDAKVQNMSVEEKEQAERMYKESVETEAEIFKQERETGKKLEHGIDPARLQVGGESQRLESKELLAYAVVLAKTVMAKKGS